MKVYCDDTHPRADVELRRDDYEGSAKVHLSCFCGLDVRLHIASWQEFERLINRAGIPEVSLAHVGRFATRPIRRTPEARP